MVFGPRSMLFGQRRGAADKHPDENADTNGHARSPSDVDAIARRAHSFADANPDLYGFIYAHSNSYAYGPHVSHADAVAGCPLCHANANPNRYADENAAIDALTGRNVDNAASDAVPPAGVQGLADRDRVRAKLAPELHGDVFRLDGTADVSGDAGTATVKEPK